MHKRWAQAFRTNWPSMRSLTLLFLGTIWVSCNVRQSSKIERPKKNDRLVSFKTNIINYQPDTLDNSEKTVNEWIISNPSGDTTNYSVKLFLSSCSKYDRDIEFKNDSLFLDYWDISEVTCTEHVLYELTYKILNKEKIKYKHELRRK